MQPGVPLKRSEIGVTMADALCEVIEALNLEVSRDLGGNLVENRFKTVTEATAREQFLIIGNGYARLVTCVYDAPLDILLYGMNRVEMIRRTGCLKTLPAEVEQRAIDLFLKLLPRCQRAPREVRGEEKIFIFRGFDIAVQPRDEQAESFLAIFHWGNEVQFTPVVKETRQGLFRG